jgi:hypothetical protein
LDDLWRLVRGEENQGVSNDTLRVVFLNMIGIKVQDREYRKTGEADETVDGGAEGDSAPTNVANIDLNKLGFFDE